MAGLVQQGVNLPCVNPKVKARIVHRANSEVILKRSVSYTETPRARLVSDTTAQLCKGMSNWICVSAKRKLFLKFLELNNEINMNSIAGTVAWIKIFHLCNFITKI